MDDVQVDDRVMVVKGREWGMKMNLDGLSMFASTTADGGIVSAETRLHFMQRGARVIGRYAGGAVRRGCLAGRFCGSLLVFRYLQLESSGELHGGRSACEVVRLPDGRTRIIEHFRWRTREGSGTNVFDEAV